MVLGPQSTKAPTRAGKQKSPKPKTQNPRPLSSTLALAWGRPCQHSGAPNRKDKDFSSLVTPRARRRRHGVLITRRFVTATGACCCLKTVRKYTSLPNTVRLGSSISAQEARRRSLRCLVQMSSSEIQRPESAKNLRRRPGR